MTGVGTLGTLLVGTGLFSAGAIAGRIAYNGYELETADIRVKNISNFYDSATPTRKTYDRNRLAGQGHSSFVFTRKTIVVDGVVRGSTQTAMETTINDMKSYLLQEQKELQIKQADGTTLVTTATTTNITFERDYYNITFCPFSITFETIEPFFYDQTIVEESRTAQTTDLSDTITRTGNYTAEPRILIQFNTGNSGVTSVGLTVNGVTMTIAETYADSDTLLINTKDLYVMYNGTAGHDYTGKFPKLDSISNTVAVDLNGTFDVDIYVMYYPTYV